MSLNSYATPEGLEIGRAQAGKRRHSVQGQVTALLMVAVTASRRGIQPEEINRVSGINHRSCLLMILLLTIILLF